jgi:putative MATE family efflux protein
LKDHTRQGSLRRKLGAAREIVRASLSDTEHDYTREPIKRGLVLLAIPMTLEMVMESVFAVADMLFVARLGADAVAAVGLTEAVLTLLYAIAVGMGLSVTAMVSRRVGEDRKKDAAVAAGQAIWIGLVISIVIGVIGALSAVSLLELMGASTEVIEIGSPYTAVIFAGSGTIVFLFLINAVFRGAGDPRIAMRALLLANGINLVLDPLLIFGIGPFPELGVLGAAIATTFSRAIGVMYQFYCLFGGASRLKFGLQDLRPVGSVMMGMLRVSIGGVSQFLIHTASWVVLVRVVAFSGSSAVAGYTIAIRIIDFTLLPAWGMSNAVATLVGQNLGAGHPDRAEQSVFRAMQLNLLVLVPFGILFIVFAQPLVMLFSSEPDVLRYGADALRIICYGYGFYAVGMVVMEAFNGAGDTMTPTIINFFVFWMIQIPLAWWLARNVGMGPYGVFYAVMIAEALLAVVGWVAFRRGSWKHKVI